MRLARATQEETTKLNWFLQFMEEISNNNWEVLKKDWTDDEHYGIFISHFSDEDGEFDSELFFDYFNKRISNLHRRVTLGYSTLYENCCDQELSYLDFNEDIKQGLQLLENKQNGIIDDDVLKKMCDEGERIKYVINTSKTREEAIEKLNIYTRTFYRKINQYSIDMSGMPRVNSIVAKTN